MILSSAVYKFVKVIYSFKIFPLDSNSEQVMRFDLWLATKFIFAKTRYWEAATEIPQEFTELSAYIGTSEECLDLLWSSITQLFSDVLGFSELSGIKFKELYTNLGNYLHSVSGVLRIGKNYESMEDERYNIYGILEAARGYEIPESWKSGPFLIIRDYELNRKVQWLLLDFLKKEFPVLLDPEISFQDLILKYKFI